MQFFAECALLAAFLFFFFFLVGRSDEARNYTVVASENIPVAFAVAAAIALDRQTFDMRAKTDKQRDSGVPPTLYRSSFDFRALCLFVFYDRGR